MTPSCDWTRDRLDRYLTGRLDPAEADLLETHVAGCAQCAADLEAARAVTPLVEALPRARQPSRDLWGGISDRIRRRGSNRWVALPVWSLAAASLLLVAGTAATTWLGVRQGRPVATNEPGGSFVTTENQYHRSIADLAGLYARTRDSLSPDTRALIERNLAVIEAAIEEARLALEREPSNPVLESLVLAAYRRKLDFLVQATGLNRDG